eukprot:UC1_evm1s932
MDVCSHAVSRIQDSGLPRRKIRLTVTTEGMYLLAKREVIKFLPLQRISFMAVEPTNKNLFSLFDNDADLKVITCHSFSTKEATALQVTISFNESVKLSKKGGDEEPHDLKKFTKQLSMVGRKSRKATAAEDELLAGVAEQTKKQTDKGKELSRYVCCYKGAWLVPQKTGADVVDSAVAKIDKAAKKKVKRGKKDEVLVVYERYLEVLDKE